MPTKINKLPLLIIVVIAILIRFINIGSMPSLNADEAALGYNAYSLIETGKDEHGVSWPLHFKSFGDYKPGGYVYLAIPFVKIFGLTPLAVRLPNLILSILTILFLYKLIFLLSKNNKLALLTATVLTLSPWHIHFSRGAWESSAALSFIIIGTYFFFKSIKEKFLLNFNLFVVFYVLSLYIYHSARLIAPLLALTLVVLYFKNLIKNLPQILIPVLFGVLLALPVTFSFLNNGGTARIGGVGLTADQGPINRANELINHHNNVKLINRVMHNKRLLYLISWGQKYTSHFDLNFLTINGDEVPRSKVPEMGQIYLIELPFLLLGIIFLLKSTIYHLRSKIFFIAFLLIAPIASSLTYQAPSALRALSMVIPLSILIALGIYYFFSFFKNKNILKVISIIFIIVYGYFVSYYFDAYFIHYSKRYPYAWEYGFDQLVPYLESQKNNYDKIYVTDKYDQPYILFLFFSKYPPEKIQQEIKLTTPDQYGFSTVLNFNKYNFQKIEWGRIRSRSLVVTSDELVPFEPIKIINFPNEQPGFKIYLKP
ncbi:MAG: phospholipid carrier-dependent glycosyltransferase [Candidatus Shapirobacteria bacterium]|nr:phospholipid carrier-dependent glycosyltransferase [Candidatus Shapirobacteria bacterium]MDD3002467.1 phospholipid carrier-dependent glycosyltransferase [Candidatus Shapirobacteria bacterium]MDD4383344.1 phospholipid carrier-dependent glycosyltransferase [Candidatus Shapirobacteria bacterium]